jgi:hypothetical protein
MTHALRILSGGIVAVMVAAFIYVGVRFPDSPIQKCRPDTHYAVMNHPIGYCGKQGQPRTEEDFHAFKIWEMTLFTIWPLGIASLAILRYVERKSILTGKPIEN